MDTYGIKSRQLSYKDFVQLADVEKVQGNIIRKLTKNNHSRETWYFPEITRSGFRDARVILLNQAGALKDDDTLDELLAHIYRERGRSETE